MARHTAEELRHEERRYILIFLLLAVLTAAELGAVHLPLVRFTIGVVLVVLALGKASLVALYYMHLAVERRTLMWIALTPLILCVWLVFMLTPDLGSLRRLWTHSAAPAAVSHEAPAAH